MKSKTIAYILFVIIFISIGIKLLISYKEDSNERKEFEECINHEGIAFADVCARQWFLNVDNTSAKLLYYDVYQENEIFSIKKGHISYKNTTYDCTVINDTRRYTDGGRDGNRFCNIFVSRGNFTFPEEAIYINNTLLCVVECLY